MDNIIYFKDLFESIIDYRKVVLLMFSINDDKNLLQEVGISKKDITLLLLEFKKKLKEEYENYLDYIKDQDESLIEGFLNK